MHVSAHLAYANSKALEAASVGPNTLDPDGGHIDRDVKGIPSGLLLEPAAIDLVKRYIPKLSVKQYRGLLKTAIAYYHSRGIIALMTVQLDTIMMALKLFMPIDNSRPQAS